jgi:hypothetical protein
LLKQAAYVNKQDGCMNDNKVGERQSLLKQGAHFNQQDE